MYLPKTDIFNILQTLPYNILQTNETVFTELPAITFRVGNNSVNVDLNSDITYQDIDMVIDIWAEDSVTASNILAEVEALMRQHGYNLNFSTDVPNVDKSLYHISTRFRTIAR